VRVTLLTFDFGESIVPLASHLSHHAVVQLILPEHEFVPFRCDVDSNVAVTAFERPRYRQPARQMRMIQLILRCVRQFQPDLLHIQQGLQVVIEDYVHHKPIRTAALLLNIGLSWVFGLLGVFAVLRIALAG
jgi:hypothetical protein